jgi:hypothetical protein
MTSFTLSGLFGNHASSCRSPRLMRLRQARQRPRPSVETLEPRLYLSATITEFNIDSQSIGISAGPDGAVWFTEIDSSKIGRITAAGVITEYATPTPGAGPRELQPAQMGPFGSANQALARSGESPSMVQSLSSPLC